MRVSRFHEEQIVRLLRVQELSGQTVATLIRRNRISRHTFYRWRKKYDGLTETEERSASSRWSARMPA